MNVLDLFSGLGGWSQAFKDRGHEVTTLDFNSKFKPDLCMDILEVPSLTVFGKDYDIVLASPPCEVFSIATVWLHHWKKVDGKYEPQDERAVLAKKIAEHTFMLLEEYDSQFYVIENPRGFMRHVIKQPDAQINWCKYVTEDEKKKLSKGFHDKRKSAYFKATDLWGRLPPSFEARRCKQGNKECHAYAGGHDSFTFATHGIRKDVTDAAKRAVLPYGLSLEMCIAMEKDLKEGNNV